MTNDVELRFLSTICFGHGSTFAASYVLAFEYFISIALGFYCMSGTILGALGSKWKRRGPCPRRSSVREASTFTPGCVRPGMQEPRGGSHVGLQGALLRTQPSQAPEAGSASESRH